MKEPEETHGHETGLVAARPVVRGTHLALASGHYLASAAGMRMVERGGNAIDAGVAAVFAQLVLELNSAGLGGECPILIYSARERRVVAINGNCRAPARATRDLYRQLGFDRIPGSGFLGAGVPATLGALVTALERYGTLPLATVIAPSIELAADGYPLYEALRVRVAATAERIRAEWPSSAELFLRDGEVPSLGTTMRNPGLARTYERLAEAEHAVLGRGREVGLRAALDRFYRGDIAREIVTFQRETTTTHDGGPVASGVLAEDDLASFETRIESTVARTFRGLSVHKCRPWSQGPVLLQQLALLDGFDLARMRPGSADLIHTVVECAKLAFADRDAYYGDPDVVRVPLDGLLSTPYAESRRALVDPRRAAAEVGPGDPTRFGPMPGAVTALAAQATPWAGGTTGTRAVDRDGNVFSATPSGGWLHSSPIIPGLGFALCSRMQAFSLDDGHPGAVAPRKQPRTTLSPSLATKDDAGYIAFGTPGGDNQDQYNLQFLLHFAVHGMDLQESVDQPAFQSRHLTSTFYPRLAHPLELLLEADIPEVVRSELASRGHVVRVRAAMSMGNLTAARVADGYVEASASARGQKAYAMAW